MSKIFVMMMPLEPDELAFLARKLSQERQSFWTVMRSLLVTSVAMPVLLLVFKSIRYPDDAQLIKRAEFPDYYFLIAALLMLLLIGFAGYISYWGSVRKLARDCREKIKVIERTTILRKVFMKENHTCHFYLNTGTRLSIEVSPKDFAFFEPGDEINIEYSRNAKEYFGYY
ncbi:MAG TPA: hypothetical protein VFL76_09250 [Edaphocola sp.]|nr:hypothetical protein [Edaphocola sp.]